MFALMLQLQRTLNCWFERLVLEDHYRYLARRGGFEDDFNRRLSEYRKRGQYSAVRLAFTDARLAHVRSLHA